MAQVKDAAAEMRDPEPIAVDGEVPQPLSGKAQAIANEAHQSMLQIMRDKYAKEKRVRVKVKNDGPVQVQVNGYSFLIREGVAVEVPESVAEILDEAGYI